MNARSRHVHTYTSAVNMDRDEQESLFWQQMYHAMSHVNIWNYDTLTWRAYSYLGMIAGFKVVINRIVIDY